MKKSQRKTKEYLKKYIGCKMLRTRHTAILGSRSYMDYPVIFLGISPNGEIIVQSDRGVSTLSIDYTDRYWTTYKKATKPKHNPLNQYKGMLIKRVKPVIYSHGTIDRSFMKEPARLVKASKTHLIVEYWGRIIIEGKEFCKKEDWEVVLS